MSNNIYDILAKLKSLETEKNQTTSINSYKQVPPRGSVINGVKLKETVSKGK